MNLTGKKLLILGATAGEISLVKRAQKYGIYVIVTDNHTDYTLAPAKNVADEAWDISWSDIDTLEKLSRESGVDGILAGYSEFRVENMIKLCERLNFPCYINNEQLEITRDKIKFKECCRKYGVPVVKEYSSIDEVNEYPVIVKPTDRAGSIGISIAHSFEELEKAYQYAYDLSLEKRDIIEKYIQEDYKKYQPQTTFIAYGADVVDNSDEEKFEVWAKEHEVSKNEYYLIVGRFVPENNYETMIREFMSSNTKKDLVIVTGYQESKLYHILNNKYHFENDSRIKFVGTIYDDALLKSVRKNAFAYLHGHEVGGTNPSLLEALGSTSLNLLLNVGFNQEVGLDSCIYWGKEKNNLKHLIEHVETFDQDYIDTLGKAAKERINNDYSWAKIVSEYENLFLRKKDL